MSSGLASCFVLYVLAVVTTCEVLSDDASSCQSSGTLIQTRLVQDTPNWAEFEMFKVKYGKAYEDEEEATRYTAFSKALERINSTNVRSLEQGFEQTQGITKFSDLTYDEFKRYLGFKPTLRLTNSEASCPRLCTACERYNTDVEKAFTDDEVNWVNLGAVTPVKNQGSCGSCWAFSTIADVEGSYFLKHGLLQAWSEEQLVQCDDVDAGCEGGMMEDGMKYIMSVDGVDDENHYPYLDCTFAGSSYCLNYEHKCLSFTSGIGLSALGRVSSYCFISYNNPSAELEIKQALFQSGPLSSAINAWSMMDYFGGIDGAIGCEDAFLDLNHGVAFVGFGKSDNTQFWIIKNSWGTDWGEDGYYRVVYGRNACGLALYVLHSVSPSMSLLDGQ